MGTRIHCVAHFDNSADNLSNPDPAATVRWGDQTWEEMMIGYFDVAWPITRDDGGKPVAQENHRDDDPQTAAETLIGMFDKDEDGQLSRNELTARQLVLFLVVDANRDGLVSLDELTAAIRKQRERQSRGSQ
jgi:hypothetical protein